MASHHSASTAGRAGAALAGVMAAQGDHTAARVLVDRVSRSDYRDHRFTVTLWTWTKGTGVSPSMMLLDDSIGNMVDSGRFVEAYQLVHKDLAANNRRLPITYDAGEEVPNLMILPPRRNHTGEPAPGHRLHTVDRPGSLEDFLANLQRENRPVNLHWSACSEIVTRRAQFGQITEGNTQNLFEVAKTYYWPKETSGA